MRLRYFEAKSIIETFKDTFGDGKIYLFGSRIDDNLKGGDIDLYIDTPLKDNLTEKKIDFLVSLKQKIGEQKIDIILSNDKNRDIEREALEKGVELDINRLRLEKYMNECKKHKIRIEKSYTKVKDIFPISATRYQQLSDDEIEAIDQYLFRFAKLQDTLGNRVFRIIVSEYEDDINTLTFIDILNKLEKIGILRDVNIWKRLREIRNDISHQYDDEPEGMAEALNNIFAYKDELIAIVDRIDSMINTNNSR